MSLAPSLFLAKMNSAIWIVIFLPILIAIMASRRRRKEGE